MKREMYLDFASKCESSVLSSFTSCQLVCGCGLIMTTCISGFPPSHTRECNVNESVIPISGTTYVIIIRTNINNIIVI